MDFGIPQELIDVFWAKSNELAIQPERMKITTFLHSADGHHANSEKLRNRFSREKLRVPFVRVAILNIHTYAWLILVIFLLSTLGTYAENPTKVCQNLNGDVDNQ